MCFIITLKNWKVIFIENFQLSSPEHDKILSKLMHLADLDDNGIIDEYDLIRNTEASDLMKDYFTKSQKNFLTKGDIVALIPELKDLEDLVEKLESCLSNEPCDSFLLNIKKLAIVTFFIFFCPFVVIL